MADCWLQLIAGEDSGRDWLPSRHHFSQCIGGLVVALRDVVEFEAVELILKSPHFPTIHTHFGVMATRFFHNLPDDKL